MPSITCPHCARVGSAKVMPPPGAKVRCPGCGERFVMPDEAPEVIDLAPDDGPIEPPPLLVPATAVLDFPDDLGPAVPTGAALDAIGDADIRAILDDPAKFAAVLANSVAAGLPDPSRPAPPMPPEPWFFGWLDQAAGFLWYLAFAALVIATLAGGGVVLMAASVDNGAIGGALVTAVIILASAFLSLLPLAIGSALIRLAVHSARCLRIIAYR